MFKIKSVIAMVVPLFTFIFLAVTIDVNQAASNLNPIDLKNRESYTPTDRITEEPSQPLLPGNFIRQPSDVGSGYSRTSSPTREAPLDLPPLKAVVIVGPIDPPENEWTNAQIADMEKAALALEGGGVLVSRFYHPEAIWDQIKTSAAGANFLFYKGHGVNWSPSPPLTVGGFSLSDMIVSPDTIRNELDLAPGAVVMLYGCFTAGSSGDDPVPISSEEAQRRVAQYADPFIDAGAGAYFANIWDESFAAYVDALFDDQTTGDVFKAFWAFDDNTFETHLYLDKIGFQLWLDPWSDTSYEARWNQALIGDPLSTLEDMANPPSLNLSTHNLLFLTEPSGNPSSKSIEISNSGWWGHSFSWSAAITDNGWLSIEPDSGTLPNSTITVGVNATELTIGTYTGSVTVSAPNVQQSPQTVRVRLVITDHIYVVHLPIIQRDEQIFTE
jgi:hypothetical protein